MTSDFRECVIIPLSMFEKFKEKPPLDSSHSLASSHTPSFNYNRKLPNKSDKLLFDSSLPSDLKMKLYQQQTKLTPPDTKYQKVELFKPPVDTSHQYSADVDSIVQELGTKNTPVASSILSRILQKQDVLTWNEKLEVIIDKKLYPNSNILELMRYVLGEKVLTSAADIPIAGEQFYLALKSIGIPVSWMKKSKYSTRSQTGSGWICLYP